MVGFAIGKQFENGVGLWCVDGFFHLIVRVGETNVALMAIVAVLLSEIAQQLSATTDVVVRGIVDHRMDALTELFLAFFIDHRW